MLRHYDSIGLVRPTGRTTSGYREYSSDDIRRIFHIESLRSLGLSLKEAGRALDDPAFDPSELVGELITRTRERIADETRLLTRLQQIGVAGAGGWEDILQIVSLLQDLGSDNAGRRQRAAMSAAEDTSMPVEALVEAVLNESNPNVAGAIRWALVQTETPQDNSPEDALALLAAALRAPSAEVRKRAVESIAEFPGPEATAQLQDALTNTDDRIRRYAAVALGSRGAASAVPTLVSMIVANRNDADAADALSALAAHPPLADQIAGVLISRITALKADSRTQAEAQAPAIGRKPGDRSPAPWKQTSDEAPAQPKWVLDEALDQPDRVPDEPPDHLGRIVDEVQAGGQAAARQRLTQALADIPGAAATRYLTELTGDDDRAVALTATYVLTLRPAVPESRPEQR